MTSASYAQCVAVMQRQIWRKKWSEACCWEECSAPHWRQKMIQEKMVNQDCISLRRMFAGRSCVEDAQPVGWTPVPSNFCLNHVSTAE